MVPSIKLFFKFCTRLRFTIHKQGIFDQFQIALGIIEDILLRVTVSKI